MACEKSNVVRVIANDQAPEGRAYVTGRELANLCSIRRDDKTLACVGDGSNQLRLGESCPLDGFRLSVKEHFKKAALQ